jgi:hypothetical protein
MTAERDRGRIKEFFELTNADFNLRKFHKPVLVYEISGDKVRYSLWEEELLERFGLKNVDGWDATEDVIYCPDWMQNKDEFEDEDDEEIDIDDLDLGKGLGLDDDEDDELDIDDLDLGKDLGLDDDLD